MNSIKSTFIHILHNNAIPCNVGTYARYHETYADFGTPKTILIKTNLRNMRAFFFKNKII